MDDQDLASLYRCAERIRERIDRTLIDMESACVDLGTLLDGLSRDDALRRADITQVQPTLLKLLDEHRGFVHGVGLAFDRDHLTDSALWLEWWRRDDDQPAHFVRHELDPANNYFYDYTSRAWFAGPRQTRRPGVTGPFVDFAGTNEHTITLAAPVYGERFVDVLGADVPVANFERLLIDSLHSRAPHVLVLNEQNRVVASASSRWWSGTLFHRETGVRWIDDIALGEHLRWRLVAGFPE